MGRRGRDVWSKAMSLGRQLTNGRIITTTEALSIPAPQPGGPALSSQKLALNASGTCLWRARGLEETDYTIKGSTLPDPGHRVI